MIGPHVLRGGEVDEQRRSKQSVVRECRFKGLTLSRFCSPMMMMRDREGGKCTRGGKMKTKMKIERRRVRIGMKLGF